MKKIITLLFILNLSLLTTYGQLSNPQGCKVNLGPVIETKDNTVWDIIGNDKAGDYCISDFKDDKQIEKYDGKLTSSLKLNFTAELKKMNKDSHWLDVVVLGNNLYILSFIEDKGNKQSVLSCQSVNTETMKLNKDLKEIYSVSYSSKNGYVIYRTNVSDDSQKLLVEYEVNDNTSSTPVGAKAFDVSMKELWESKGEVPIVRDTKFSEVSKMKNMSRCGISNSGLAYALFKNTFKKTDKEQKGNPNYNFKIYIMGSDFKEPNEITAELAGKYICSINITMPETKELLITGIYSSTTSEYGKGVFYSRTGVNAKELQNVKTSEFTKDFLTADCSASQAKKLEKDQEPGSPTPNTGLYIKKVILNKDGSVNLIGEQNYTQTSIAMEQQTVMHRGAPVNERMGSLEVSGSVFVIKLNDKGDIVWNTKIPKTANSSQVDRKSMSFASIAVNDKIYVVYNDNSGNMDKENIIKHGVYNFDYGNHFGSSIACLSLATVDADGAVTHEPIMSYKSIDEMGQPKVNYKMANDELLVYCENKNNKSRRFLKLTFGK